MAYSTVNLISKAMSACRNSDGNDCHQCVDDNVEWFGVILSLSSDLISFTTSEYTLKWLNQECYVRVGGTKSYSWYETKSNFSKLDSLGGKLFSNDANLKPIVASLSPTSVRFKIIFFLRPKRLRCEKFHANTQELFSVRTCDLI